MSDGNRRGRVPYSRAKLAQIPRVLAFDLRWAVRGRIRLMGRILSVPSLVSYVDNHCNKGLYLFWGQKFDKPLLPKIGRDHFLSDNFLGQEKRLLDDFKIRSNPYLDSSTRDDWDWLAIAQHNGMATRLLDWTDNPLAALWFAVREEAVKGNPGVL
jgi:hypothetical protein